MSASAEFIELIDIMILGADGDEELKDGIRLIDEKARREGISFYDMVDRVIRNHILEKKAKEWRSSQTRR